MIVNVTPVFFVGHEMRNEKDFVPGGKRGGRRESDMDGTRRNVRTCYFDTPRLTRAVQYVGGRYLSLPVPFHSRESDTAQEDDRDNQRQSQS